MDENMMIARHLRLLIVLSALGALSGCAVVDLTATVVGTTADVATTVVSTTADVVTAPLP